MESLSEHQKNTVDALRKRYAGVHEVLFLRAVERAKDETELFDILESLPEKFPLAWNAEQRQFTAVADVLKQE